MSSPLQAEDEKKALIFGVHSYLPATILLERFSPLTKYLEQQMGIDIHLRVSSNYQDHIDSISHNKYDFAYMGPASYVKLTSKVKDYPLLGRLSFSGKNTLRGAIIIRQNSPISSLKELKGKSFAFGDPESTLSSKVPLRMLENIGVKLTDLKLHAHLKNHHNVALAVLMGKYDAGGIKEEVFLKYQSRGLKVLQWSPEIPTHPFVACRSMSKLQVHQLKTLLQGLHLQHDADKILQHIKKGTTAIIPAQIEDYEQLRQFIAPEKAPETELQAEHKY